MPEGYKNGKPDVAYWLREIRLGIQWRKDRAFEQKWPQWRNYYRGEWQGGVLPSNMYFKMMRTIVPRIYFRNPSISITPAQPGLENVIFAKLLERTDNKLIRAMKVKKHIKRMVQEAWMFGTGVGKKGFGAEFHSTPETFGETTAPDAGKGKMQDSVEYDYDVMSNMPWFRNTATGSFVVPAGTRFIEEARWTCFQIKRPAADVRIDPRFKNAKDLGPTQLSMQTSEYKLRIQRDIELIDLFEIRDKKTGKVFVITPALTDKVLLFEDDEFARLRIRAENTLVFNDDDEGFWGVPDSQILEPLQLELNEIRTYTMYHRRVSIARIIAQKGAFSDEEKRKLVGPDVHPIVESNGSPMTSFKEFTPQGIPPGLLESDALVRQDIQESLGFSRNEFGEMSQGSRKNTAEEVKQVAAAVGIRIDERRDMIADMLVDMITDYHPIIFNHWTQPQVAEIIGPAGIPFWIQFRPQMLNKINYNVKVDPDTAIPETKDLRESKAVKVYELFKTNPLIDPVKLTSYLLHNMHGVEFDDMMRGIPLGAGLQPDKPLSVGQFGKVIQNTAQKNPELLQGPTGAVA